MSVAIAIAFVMTTIQFLKKVIPLIEGSLATVLVVLLSAGVTVYKFATESLPLGIPALAFFGEVVVGALGAYSLIKTVKTV